jgi:hypothetical protein
MIIRLEGTVRRELPGVESGINRKIFSSGYLAGYSFFYFLFFFGFAKFLKA